MWKKYDIRAVETNQYFGTVETETPFDAAKIHFAVNGIDVSKIEVDEDNPFEVTVDNIKYKIVEDKEPGV